MKTFIVVVTAVSMISISLPAQTGKTATEPGKHKTSGKGSAPKQLYIDVHQLEPGKVKFEDVAAAHAKDLATEKKYGVHFIKYWVDEEKGTVYCLSSSSNRESITKTHAEAHGLLPNEIFPVVAGEEAAKKGKNDYFLDIHHLGAGKVTAAAVAEAHKKDLAVEKKYGVHLINYWVDEKEGVVMCLAQAKDSNDLTRTHKEAHGLLPDRVIKVKQGQ